MSQPLYILGINYRPVAGLDIGHHPSAVLLRDGQIVAMCEEERFVRVKEAPGFFPVHAIRFCLNKAAIAINDVAAVGWNWNPVTAAERSRQQKGVVVGALASALQYGLRHTPLRPLSSVFAAGFRPEQLVEDVRSELVYWFGLPPDIPLLSFDHHLAHAASAFFSSGFTQATIVTWDCWGDHLSGLVARGVGNTIEVLEEVPFGRSSIGMLNDFVFEFLRTSEKGNLMGLAAYGTPKRYLDDLVDLERMTMRMDLLGRRAPFPDGFVRRAGPPRRLGEPLEQRHKDLAADLQEKIECFGATIVRRAVAATGLRDVCVAGGCALNATLNGKLTRSGLLDGFFAQPQAGDAGGALGAAYLAHLAMGRGVPRQVLRHAYWGPSFTNEQIIEQVEDAKVSYEIVGDEDIAPLISQMLIDQRVVGWFQLGSEWGPRALGARSILADPRSTEIRDRVNRAVKYRDWWRPFAPSMLPEAMETYLEAGFDAPFMIVTFPVRKRKERDIPGVVHADGTTRPQVLHRDVNPRYYDTIRAFADRTGVPMVLNTSFNLRGEPIVDTPRDALRTFFSSGLDALIMGNVLVTKCRR